MAKEEDTVKAVILRAFWDADGVRQDAGKKIDVTRDALIDGMEKGILARSAE